MTRRRFTAERSPAAHRSDHARRASPLWWRRRSRRSWQIDRKRTSRSRASLAAAAQSRITASGHWTERGFDGVDVSWLPGFGRVVNGTLGSVRKRSTSGLRVLSRSSRLWPTRRNFAYETGLKIAIAVQPTPPLQLRDARSHGRHLGRVTRLLRQQPGDKVLLRRLLEVGAIHRLLGIGPPKSISARPVAPSQRASAPP